MTQPCSFHNYCDLQHTTNTEFLRNQLALWYMSCSIYLLCRLKVNKTFLHDYFPYDSRKCTILLTRWPMMARHDITYAYVSRDHNYDRMDARSQTKFRTANPILKRSRDDHPHAYRRDEQRNGYISGPASIFSIWLETLILLTRQF